MESLTETSLSVSYCVYHKNLSHKAREYKFLDEYHSCGQKLILTAGNIPPPPVFEENAVFGHYFPDFEYTWTASDSGVYVCPCGITLERKTVNCGDSICVGNRLGPISCGDDQW
jgi:hypothetical protein